MLLACEKSSVAQLVLSPGSSITIKDGTSLYVGTSLYIKSDASGSGYLADQNSSGNCTIAGDKTVERYLTANGWHNISSPVSNANSNEFTGTDLIFYYDETIILNDWDFGWVWYDGSLSVMKGYDIFLPSTITANYTATGGELLNTGSYNIDVTRTNVANGEAENRKGWNLIGNPYPSPVDWLLESGWDKSDINDAKYIWNPSNNNYTIFLGGSSPTGINGGTQYIPSNQGYWVQAVQNGNISISNATRLGIMTSTPDYYKISNTTSEELRLIASGNGYTDETMIRFLNGTTSGFDINNDASKLFSTHDYLKDLREQKMIYLNSQKIYHFYHDPSYSKSRFIIYFNPSQDVINSINPKSYFNISTYKNTLTITRNTAKQYNGEVSIYNMHGQRLTSFQLSNNIKTNVKLSVPAGYYIVSIVTENQVINSKIRIIY